MEVRVVGSDQYLEIRGFGGLSGVRDIDGAMYEGHNFNPTSKGSLRALLVLVVKGNRSIRAISDSKWCRYGKGTTAYSKLASHLM